MIICAAIRLETAEEMLTIPCYRHGNGLIICANLKDKWQHAKKTQGFIDHNGNFLDRVEAFEHFKECGQSNATQRYYWEDRNQNELYSEDLY